MRAIFLDSTSIEKLLKRTYLVSARKFYSQTIVEVYSNIKNDEDLNGFEIDNEHMVVR